MSFNRERDLPGDQTVGLRKEVDKSPGYCISFCREAEILGVSWFTDRIKVIEIPAGQGFELRGVRARKEKKKKEGGR